MSEGMTTMDDRHSDDRAPRGTSRRDVVAAATAALVAAVGATVAGDAPIVEAARDRNRRRQRDRDRNRKKSGDSSTEETSALEETGSTAEATANQGE